MDIDLSPEVKWIDGCCYRINRTNDKSNIINLNEEEHIIPPEIDCCSEETGDMECNVENLPNGLQRVQLTVPKIFWGRLIGMKGATRKRIEEETRCTIHVPRPTDNGNVEVTGRSERDVLLACSHIKETVRVARMSAKVTHFISIPVQDTDIKAEYMEFKRKATSLDPNLNENWFTNSERLHLTLVVLLLVDAAERQKAKDIFQQASELVTSKLKDNPLKIELKELETFTDDLKSCTVVYSKVENNLLQEIANEVANLYYSTGLVKDRDIRETVKLHLTLLNTAYQPVDDNPQHKFGRREKPSFDASKLFAEMKNYKFGTFVMKALHLSEMGSEGGDKNQYYKSLAVCNL